MDKYEYKLKNEEIKKKIKQREFQEAVIIADTIDWTRVRSVTTLCTISDLYKINRRYKEAKILLEQAYERYPSGRMIVYSLCELCIKMEEIVQAIEYYKQFVQMAPTDNGKFILQYKIYEAQDVSLEERIAVLEELKKREYKEKWGYELAYLYHRIGLTTKCVEECDELILWFREGTYVKKAMELKMLHQQLTENQMDIYQSMLPPKEKEEFIRQNTLEIKEVNPEDDIMVKTMDISKYNTLNLQRELAESMKDVLVADNGFAPLASADDENAQPGTYIPDDFSVDKLKEPVVRRNEHPGTTTENMSRTIFRDEALSTSPIPSSDSINTGTLMAKNHNAGEMEEIIFEDEPAIPEYAEEQPEESFAEMAEEAVDVSAPYDPVKDLELTMMYDAEHVSAKLEAYKAANKEEDIDEEALEEAQIPKVGMNTAELIALDDTVEIVEPIEATKVFNKEELHAVAKAYNSSLKADSYGFDFNDPSIKQPHEDLSDYINEDIGDRNKEELLELIDMRVQEAILKALDTNREIVTPVVSQPIALVAPVSRVAQDQVPKGMENILSQEYDGQMSLVVPDAPIVEKQITGQMSIEDVLNEWESRKKQQMERSEQSVAKRFLAETGNLFTDTESLRIDGILEKLQRDEVPEDVDTEAEYEKYISQLTEQETAESKQEQEETPKEESVADAVSSAELIEEKSDEVLEESTETEETEESANVEENTEEVPIDSDFDEITSEEADSEQKAEPEVSPEVAAAQAQALAAKEAAELAAAQAEAARKIAEEAAAIAAAAQAQAEAEAEKEGLSDESDEVEELTEIEENDDILEEDNVESENESEISDSISVEEPVFEQEPEVIEEKISEPVVEKISISDKTETSKTSEENTSVAPAEDNSVDGRAMSEDELTLFAQFAQTKRARQNLLHSLDRISLAAYTGNVFVTGETADESLELAKNVIRYVKNTDGNFTGKIAKVSGDALNNKMISVMVEKLASGGLIIEKASGMSAETTKDLLKSLNQEKTGIVVALQDTKKNMHKMMEYFDGMKQIFNVHIEVEELSDDALVAYGKKYAEHLEYSIDDMGILALHQRIDVLQTSDHVVTVSDVRDILDEAIERANKKSFRHFTDVLLAKRYDDEDMIILRENDFITKD